FWIDEIPSDVDTRATVVQTVAHRERAHVDSAKAVLIAFGDQFSLIVPKFIELLWIFFDGLNEQGSGHVRETLAHPLVAIRIEANFVAPPLVSYFVRRDDLPIAAVAEIEPKAVADGLVEEGADRQP